MLLFRLTFLLPIVIRYVFFFVECVCVFFVLSHRFMPLSSVEVGHFPALHNKNHSRLISIHINVLNSKNVPLIKHVCVCARFMFLSVIQLSWMWVVICSILLITLKRTEVKTARTHVRVECILKHTKELLAVINATNSCSLCFFFFFIWSIAKQSATEMCWARKRTNKRKRQMWNKQWNEYQQASNTSKSHLYFGLSYSLLFYALVFVFVVVFLSFFVRHSFHYTVVRLLLSFILLWHLYSM